MAHKIGFVGLGLMGLGLARNLLAAGHTVRGFDLSPAALTAFQEAGGVPAASPADAARDADFVMTVLPEPRDVEAVLVLAKDAVATAHRPISSVARCPIIPGAATMPAGPVQESV